MADFTAFLAASIVLDEFITMKQIEYSSSVDQRWLK